MDSALLGFSMGGHLEITKEFLIKNGTDNYASLCGHLEVVKELIKNGADETHNKI